MNTALLEALVAMIKSSGSAEHLMQEHQAVRGRCTCCKAGPSGGGVMSPCTTYTAASIAFSGSPMPRMG